MNITIMPGILGKVHKTISNTAVKRGEGQRRQVVVKTVGKTFVTRHIVQHPDGKWYAQVFRTEHQAHIQEVET